MDKQALRRAWGGPLHGAIATHIVPNTMFNNQLQSYDPYKTPNESGDLAKAQAEMKLSKYDSNHDGKCDSPVCKNVLFVNRNTSIWTSMEPIIVQDAAKLGIQLKPREFEDAYPIIQTTSKNIPLSAVPGWGKDYADPGTFMVLFDSRSILPSGNVNYSLVGVTSSQATSQKLGLNSSADLNNVPSVDSKIDACNKLTGSARMTCWENLDKYLMTSVVPWVPYLDATNIQVVGPAVTKYEYDQFGGTMGYAHVAVDPSKQKGGTG
jgi:ABC-type oligopeptide transport system substrate-binding subunit